MKKMLFGLLLILCLLPLTALTEEGKPLYAVKDENGLWGYIDCKGNLVIPGTFAEAEDFRGNYALVRQDWGGLYGIIDAKGEWALPPVDGYCREFRDGLARIDVYPDVIFVDRDGKTVYLY